MEIASACVCACVYVCVVCVHEMIVNNNSCCARFFFISKSRWLTPKPYVHHMGNSLQTFSKWKPSYSKYSSGLKLTLICILCWKCSQWTLTRSWKPDFELMPHVEVLRVFRFTKKKTIKSTKVCMYGFSMGTPTSPPHLKKMPHGFTGCPKAGVPKSGPGGLASCWFPETLPYLRLITWIRCT